MHDAAQLLDLRTEPLELFLGHAVMLRVARLDVGILKFFEPRTIPLELARPDISEARINPLSLGPQEGNVVVMRRVERADE